MKLVYNVILYLPFGVVRTKNSWNCIILFLFSLIVEFNILLKFENDLNDYSPYLKWKNKMLLSFVWRYLNSAC